MNLRIGFLIFMSMVILESHAQTGTSTTGSITFTRVGGAPPAQNTTPPPAARPPVQQTQTPAAPAPALDSIPQCDPKNPKAFTRDGHVIDQALSTVTKY